MGLFTSKSDLLRWQQILMPNTKRLVMNKQQLQAESKRRASGHIKIIQDCIRLVNETEKPDVFFKRLAMLKSHAYELAMLEPYVRFSGTSPSESLREIEEKEQNSIRDFIDRYHGVILAKIGSLKTDSAKEKKCHEFYDNLEIYFLNMDYQNATYANDLYKGLLDKLSLSLRETVDTIMPSHDLVDNNLTGIKYEKAGEIENAIVLYEYNIQQRFDGNHPYDRLAIIYRKRKDYDNEIRVLNMAIDVFSNDVHGSRSDKSPKLAKFYDRLKKATELRDRKNHTNI